MVNYKIYTFLFIMLCACILISTTISAEDISNDTQQNNVITAQQTNIDNVVEDTSDNKEVVEKELKTTDKKSISKTSKEPSTLATTSKNKTVITKNNEITNNTRSIKKTDKTVSSYTELSEAITKETTDSLNITLTSGDYTVTSKITITNDTLKRVIINGNNQIIEQKTKINFLIISKGVTVYLNNVTIRNTEGSYFSTIINNGTLYINNSSVNGLIDSSYSSLIINNSKFIGNPDKWFDTSIYIPKGSLSMYNSVFINNTDSVKKGFLFNLGWNNEIVNCTFINNTGKKTFMNTAGKVVSINNTFINNSGKGLPHTQYGAIDCQGQSLFFINNVFINNTSKTQGVLMIPLGCNVTAINCSFINSSSSEMGVVDNNGNYTSINCTYINNSGGSAGGVISTIGNYTSINDVFINNSADTGGIIYQRYHSTIASNTNIQNATMINNTATTQGGLIYNEKKTKTLNITNSLIANNTATNSYLIYNLGNITIKNNNFINNTNIDKEDILLSNGTVNTTVTNNTYADNCLKTFVNATNQVLGSDKVGFDITVNLREVYNHTINSGKILVYVNNQQYLPSTDFNVNNGKVRVEVPLNLLTQASNNITFTYSAADNSYQSSNASVLVTSTSTKENVHMSVEIPETFTVGNAYQINITLRDNSTRVALVNQELTIKTETITTTVKTDSDGIATYQYIVSSNDNTFAVSYAGSDDYYGTTQSYRIVVGKVSTNISISGVKSAKINDKIELNATLTDNAGKPLANKEIIFAINNQEYKTNTNEKGIATYTYTPTATGTIKVAVKYDGDNAYESSTNTTQFTVEKIKTNLNIEAETIAKLNKTATITITLTDENNANIMDKEITLTVNGTVLTNKTNKDGIATVTYTPTAVGEYSVIATFNGDDNYISSTDSTKFTVNKINTSIAINNIGSVMIGSKTAIKVTLLDEDGSKLTDKTITLTIDEDSTNIKTDSDGTAIYEYAAATSGVKTITAKYEGNSDYNANQITSTITVTSKKTTNLNIQAFDTKINKTTTITITLADEDSDKLSGKTVTIRINNETFTKTTDGEGIATFEYTPKLAGGYVVTANFKEDSEYLASSSTAQFTAQKFNTFIVISNPDSIMVDHNAEIKVVLTDENNNKLVDKTIILTIGDNTSSITTNDDGVASYNYTSVSEGKKEITAKYEGDSDYNANQTTSIITVTSKKITKLDVQALDTKINKTITITVTLTDDNSVKLSDKTVTITVNGETFTNTTDGNGIATFSYTPKTSGEITVTAKFTEDDNYASSSSTVQFAVSKLTTILIIDDISSLKVNDTAVITVTLTDEDQKALSSKEIILTVNGTTLINTTNVKGIAIFNYVPVHAGKYNVNAVFTEDDSFLSSSIITQFTVNKLDTSLAISSDESVIRGNNALIKVTLRDEDGKLLTGKSIILMVDGISTSITTDCDGVASYTYATSTIGIKSITAKYDGGDDYNSNQATSTITVTGKTVTNINVQAVNTKINKTAVVRVALTDDNQKALSNKEIILSVNGTAFTNTTDDDGVAIFNYLPNHAGEYNLNAMFTGDNNFEGSENSMALTVDKLSTVITAIVVNDTARNAGLNITLADENGKSIIGTVVVKDMSNVTLASSMTNGDGNVQIDLDLLAGRNSLTVVYDGSDAYLSNITSLNVDVKRSDVTLALPDYDMFIFDYSNITVNVTDEYGNSVNGGYVIFKVNGVTLKSNSKFYSQETNPMKFTVTNGKVNIVFNATSFYNKKYVHSMIVKYSGTTSQYNSASSDTKTLSINKRVGYMMVTTDKTSYNLYETVNIQATYYDITHGNATPIYADGSCYAIYKINGVTSKVNGSDEKFAINNSQVLIGNNSKSQINYIHIDHTAPNKKNNHTIEVKTHNEYYTTLTANTTIILNKSPTHIDINSVTYNKTSNKITISANIKDYKNNNTKGVNYYSVKINGITYKVNSQTTFNTTGGNIEITINSTTKNIRNIELVTREKLAYDGSRTTTTNIQTVK